jgi:hypothetical protein
MPQPEKPWRSAIRARRRMRWQDLRRFLPRVPLKWT